MTSLMCLFTESSAVYKGSQASFSGVNVTFPQSPIPVAPFSLCVKWSPRY